MSSLLLSLQVLLCCDTRLSHTVSDHTRLRFRLRHVLCWFHRVSRSPPFFVYYAPQLKKPRDPRWSRHRLLKDVQMVLWKNKKATLEVEGVLDVTQPAKHKHKKANVRLGSLSVRRMSTGTVAPRGCLTLVETVWQLRQTSCARRWVGWRGVLVT